MYARFYRIVLSRKTESVEAYRKKDIVPLHTLLSCDNFKSAVRLDMSDVHSCAARIRELNKRVKLLFCLVFFCDKDFFIIPTRLPLFFDFRKIVIHCLSVLLFYVKIHFNLFAVFPKAFEIVKRTRFLAENVHYYILKIEKDPVPAGLTLSVQFRIARFFETVFALVRKRADLR